MSTDEIIKTLCTEADALDRRSARVRLAIAALTDTLPPGVELDTQTVIEVSAQAAHERAAEWAEWAYNGNERLA